MLNINYQAHDRADNFTIRNGETSVVLSVIRHIPETAQNAADQITQIFADISQQAETLNRDLSVTGLANKLRAECKRLRKPFRDLVEAGIESERHIARTDDRLTTLPEPSAIEPAIIAHVTSLAFPDRIEFANRANSQQLAAMIRTGHEIVMREADSETWHSVVILRYRGLRLIEAYSLQGAFAKTSTLQDPFGPARPDQGRAEAEAKRMLAAVEHDRTAIGHLRQVVQDTVKAVAVMCSAGVDEAFSFLSGEAEL